MKKLLRKLFSHPILRYLLYTSKKYYPNFLKKDLIRGFTLIELLVAMVITSIIVTVMLTFLVGVLDSSRKEQAKSASQEEIQAAINYIADDLQEALYIYDATSLGNISTQLPHTQSDAPTECSTATKCTPVLVFWKRYAYAPTAKLPIPAPTPSPLPSPRYLGCLPYDIVSPNCNTDVTSGGLPPIGGDNFTYSLVAYYLKSDVGSNGTTWSNTARILRWELKDGYRWSCADPNGACIPKRTARFFSDGLDRDYPLATNPNPIYPNSKYDAAITDKNAYFISPDRGFSRPDFLSAGTLPSLGSKWRKFDEFDFSTNGFTTLVDFIDDTKYDNTVIKVDVGEDNVDPTQSDCADPTKGVGVADATMIAQRVPAKFDDPTSNPSELTSFYACVAPEQVTARVYIRGNALARIVPSSTLRTPTANNSPFFPTINARVFGRSSLGLGKQSS